MQITDNLLHAAVEQVIVLRQGSPSEAGVSETRIVSNVVVFVMPGVGDVDHSSSCSGSCSSRMRLGATLFERLELARSAQ